jgi:hypothetical protein
MEEYIKREIDRFVELLLAIAHKMGLFLDDVPEYPLSDLDAEFERVQLGLDLDDVLAREYPVLYLVEHKNISDRGLEAFVELLFHSDLEDARKEEILQDAVNYLDNKGYYSFRLHALLS